MRTIKQVLSALLTLALVLSVVTSSVASSANDSFSVTGVNITGKSAVEIESELQSAINTLSPGDSLTVTGEANQGRDIITLNIPQNITLVWTARSKGLSFSLDGGGTFEVADGADIEVEDSFGYAIYVTCGNVNVSGGRIYVFGQEMVAIDVYVGDINVSGGEITADGEWYASYGVAVNESGSITVTGGKVSAASVIFDPIAIYINGGIAAYLAGTCEGEFQAGGVFGAKSVIVEAASLEVDSSCGGGSDGLTIQDSANVSSVKWDFSGETPRISADDGVFLLTWVKPVTPPPAPPVEYAVRLAQSGGLYETLHDAIAAAKDAGYSDFTLEVVGDVTETKDIIIGAESVTIVGAEGAHTISFASPRPPSGYLFSVDGGGSLTLGDGTTSNILTIEQTISVKSGHVTVHDGITIKDGMTALHISGDNATAEITGGRFDGQNFSASIGTALDVSKGATITEISGGVFVGTMDALHVSDEGTVIHEISGGYFYQTNPDITAHGHSVFVQNQAEIGEISGGYFESVCANALSVVRGSSIGEISGGEFVVKRDGPIVAGDRHSAVWIEYRGDSTNPAGTGIGIISGGLFKGRAFGAMVVATSGNAYINYITGGTFEGEVALQVDRGGSIVKISGGSMTGATGILNAGAIGEIGGNAEIYGTGAYGIYNYSGAAIDEISGGRIEAKDSADDGIMNAGVIKLISGGTIIGRFSAIESNGFAKGTIEVITNGVFLAEYFQAISLAYPVTLEPDLTASKGLGRYWGGNGQVFNDEDLVNYPYNDQVQADYFMSDETEAVSGIAQAQFKYLRLPAPPTHTVTFAPGEHGAFEAAVHPDLEAGLPTPAAPATPGQEGWIFAGWQPEVSETVTDDAEYIAQWVPQPDEPQQTYTVTFAPGEHGAFEAAVHPDLEAGLPTPAAPATPGQEGWIFAGWQPEVSETVTDDAEYIAQWAPVVSPPVNPPVNPPVKPPVDPPVDPPIHLPEPDLPIAPFIEDHLAYIIGYPEGDVRPNNNIIRAEVATVFFRLLTDKMRTANWTQTNPYSDVSTTAWYNNAVSVMNSMGIVNGYPDGRFDPSGEITRSELAVISARFARLMDMSPSDSVRFHDIEGHWAQADIEYAAAIGWVKGYTDGNYRPDQNITRAEFMTLANRMLGREPETAHDLLDAHMRTWPDNADVTAWYYLAVQEATNSHEPRFKGGNTVPGLRFEYEYWVAMQQNPDWAQLETSWATANP